MRTIDSIYKVFSSNVVALLIGIVQGLIVPKILGISEYAILKTFALYASCIGVFSFGFVDGIYLKYGGIELGSISKRTLKKELLFFTSLELSIAALLFALFLFSDSVVIFLFSIFLLGSAIRGFMGMLFQATGRFSEFSLMNIVSPVLNFFGILIILFVLGIESAYSLIILDISVAYISVVIFLPVLFRSVSDEKPAEKSSHNFYLIRRGFPVMLGNLASIILLSIDRWFVKLFLLQRDFAFYSFATSMMGIVMVLVTSLATAFYPLLVRRREEEKFLRSLKHYILILSSFAGAAYFAFDFIINWILKDYLPSLEVISTLFAGFPAIMVINTIFVNMYKAEKVEKKYFFTVFAMTVVAFVLNALALTINRSNLAIALATTIAFYFWFFFSSKDFKGTKSNLREITYIGAFLIVFFTTTRLFPWWIGLLIYSASILGITLLLYRREFFELIEHTKPS